MGNSHAVEGDQGADSTSNDSAVDNPMENRFLEHVLPGRHEGAGERVRFSVDCLFDCGNDSSCQRPATPSSSWHPVKTLVDRYVVNGLA